MSVFNISLKNNVNFFAGSFTLPLAKFGRKVLAVEALDVNLQHVCASLMAGNLQDYVYLVHNAVSDSNSVVKLGKHSNNMGGTYVDEDADHIKQMKHGYARGTFGLVHTITMDDLLDLPIIQEFDKVLIKMDIEGFEDRAIKSAHKLFRTLDVRGVFMEWLFHAGKQTAVTIIDFMKEHNYKPYSFDSWLKPLNFTDNEHWPNDMLWLPEL